MGALHTSWDDFLPIGLPRLRRPCSWVKLEVELVELVKVLFDSAGCGVGSLPPHFANMLVIECNLGSRSPVRLAIICSSEPLL